MKKCYYELLGIEKSAISDEIKAAYRKKALQLHPDKNPSAEAKELFQEINEAYSVLSDPNERTWYDNHRSQILNSSLNENADDVDPDFQACGINIWSYFTSSCYKNFNDDQDGFYSVYRTVFEKIKVAEEKAFENDSEEGDIYVKAPGFGDSKTGGEKVAEFYTFWESFVTYQQFYFVEKYNPNQAENRQIRRIIEKENKKERTKEKKNFIKTVRTLVEFVKKRDPRFREYSIQLEKLEKQKAEEKLLQEKEKKKLKQELKKLALEEELQRYKEEDEIKAKEKAELEEDESMENEEIPEFFCEICDKEFKSKPQLENHNQSKQHQKNLRKMYEEVAFEEEKPALNESQPSQPKKKNKKKKKKGKNEPPLQVFKHSGKEEEKLDEENPDGDNEEQIKTQNSKFIDNDEKDKKISEKSNPMEKTNESDRIPAQNEKISNPIKNKGFSPASKFFQTKTKEDLSLEEEKNSEDEDENLDEEEDLACFANFGRQKLQKAHEKMDHNEEHNETKNHLTKKEEKSKMIPQNEEKTNSSFKQEKKAKNSKACKEKENDSGRESDISESSNGKELGENKKISNETNKKQKNCTDNKEDDNKKRKNDIEEKGKSLKKEDGIKLEETRENNEEPVLNKAKARRMKKKEREEQEDNSLKCNVCGEKFDSKNRLFKHLKDKKHEMKV